MFPALRAKLVFCSAPGVFASQLIIHCSKLEYCCHMGDGVSLTSLSPNRVQRKAIRLIDDFECHLPSVAGSSSGVASLFVSHLYLVFVLRSLPERSLFLRLFPILLAHKQLANYIKFPFWFVSIFLFSRTSNLWDALLLFAFLSFPLRKQDDRANMPFDRGVHSLNYILSDEKRTHILQSHQSPFGGGGMWQL